MFASFESVEQASTTIVGNIPAGATQFKFTEGDKNAVTYIKTGKDGKSLSASNEVAYRHISAIIPK